MPKKSYKSKKRPAEGTRGTQVRDDSRHGRPKKGVNNSFYDDERAPSHGTATSKPNDWRWYAVNEQLLKDSASFPYSWPLGQRLNLGPYAPEVNKGGVAGICTIHTSPTFGWSVDSMSPINTAAKALYTKCVYDKSGKAPFDYPDLMIYLCAMDSIYSYHAWMKRVYGVVHSWDYVNRYYANFMCEAMGVDYRDLRRNLANYREFVNQWATQIARLSVPASLPFMAKHMWLYSGFYLDSDQPKAQTYMFNPHGFYKFELQNDAGAIKFEELLPIPTHYPESKRTLLKLSDIMDYADLLSENVFNNQDFGYISAYILNAFGDANLLKPDIIDENYNIKPVYDEEVLDQIQNASLIGDWAFPPSLLQNEDKEYLIFNPQFVHPYTFDVREHEHPGQNVFLSNRIVTFNRSVVEPQHTMEATRLTNICTEFSESGTETYLCKTLGSEVAHAATIYWTVVDESGELHNLEWSEPIYIGLTHMLTSGLGGVADSVTKLLDRIGITESTTLDNLTTDQWINIRGYLLSLADATRQNYVSEAQQNRDTLMRDARLVQHLAQFDRHFPVAITTGIQTNVEEWPAAYGRYTGQILDVNYNTVLTEQDLRTMSETALLSEFLVKSKDSSPWT